MFTYAFYCAQFPLAPLISFATIITTYFSTRIALIYDYRRPINKSQTIIAFYKYSEIIFVVGLAINIWLNTFVLGYIEKNYFFIFDFAPKPLNRSTNFLIKFAVSVAFFLIGLLLGRLGRLIYKSFFSDNTLICKFYPYCRTTGQQVQTLRDPSGRAQNYKQVTSSYDACKISVQDL